jgi:hypothetical protein
MQYNLVKQFTFIKPTEENIWDFKFDKDSITFKEGDIIDLNLTNYRYLIAQPSFNRQINMMNAENENQIFVLSDMTVKNITDRWIQFNNNAFDIDFRISVKTMMNFDQIKYLDNKKCEWMDLKLENRNGGVFDEHIELGMAYKFLIEGIWITGIVNYITEGETVSIATGEGNFDFYIRNEAVYVSHDGQLTVFGNIPFVPLVEEK